MKNPQRRVVLVVGGQIVNPAQFMRSPGGVFAPPDRMFVPVETDPNFQALTKAVESTRQRD